MLMDKCLIKTTTETEIIRKITFTDRHFSGFLFLTVFKVAISV